MNVRVNKKLKKKTYEDIKDEYIKLGFTEDEINNIVDEMIETQFNDYLESKGLDDYDRVQKQMK